MVKKLQNIITKHIGITFSTFWERIGILVRRSGRKSRRTSNSIFVKIFTEIENFPDSAQVW